MFSRYFFRCSARKLTVRSGIGGIGGAVSGRILVIRILEGVAGIFIDSDLYFLALLFHGGFEFVHIVGGDAEILAAEGVGDLRRLLQRTQGDKHKPADLAYGEGLSSERYNSNSMYIAPAIGFAR